MSRADEYRSERAAQDTRYEIATGLPVGDKWRGEYRDYFGVGDCSGSTVEQRLTFRLWLETHKAEREPESLASVPDVPVTAVTTAGALISAEAAFYLYRDDLQALADAGCTVCVAELARRAAKRAAKRGAVAA